MGSAGGMRGLKGDGLLVWLFLSTRKLLSQITVRQSYPHRRQMNRGKKETRVTDVGLGMQVNSWWCNAHGVYHRGLSTSLQQLICIFGCPWCVDERLTRAASPPSLQPTALMGKLQQQAVISWGICLEVCEWLVDSLPTSWDQGVSKSQLHSSSPSTRSAQSSSPAFSHRVLPLHGRRSRQTATGQSWLIPSHQCWAQVQPL